MPQPQPASTRKPSHWNHHVTPDNPRGYTDAQLSHITAAPTLAKKRWTELEVMRKRRTKEQRQVQMPDDDFGLERIAKYEADIEAQYPLRRDVEVGAG
jgi:hypothetical protein